MSKEMTPQERINAIDALARVVGANQIINRESIKVEADKVINAANAKIQELIKEL